MGQTLKIRKERFWHGSQEHEIEYWDAFGLYHSHSVPNRPSIVYWYNIYIACVKRVKKTDTRCNSVRSRSGKKMILSSQGNN
jgi:hypothetical protein